MAEDDDLVMMPFEIQEVRTSVKTEPSDDIVEVVHPTAVQALQVLVIRLKMTLAFIVAQIKMMLVCELLETV